MIRAGESVFQREGGAKMLKRERSMFFILINHLACN